MTPQALAPQTGWPIGAGGISTVIALAAFVTGFFGGAHRFALGLLFTMGALSFLFSLGNHLSFRNCSPWNGLVSYVPGFSQVRSAYRFAYFVQIAMVLASAIGIDTFAKADRKSVRWIVVVIAILSTLDPWQGSTKLGVAPTADEMRAGWASRLKNEPLSGVLILPLHEGGTARDYEVVTEWMLHSLQAGKPLVNGYSGFFPKEQLALARRIREEGLSERVTTELSELGVEYVVISPYHEGAKETEHLVGLRMGADMGKWQVFKIER